MFEDWINNRISDYLKNNADNILGNISDETISGFFDKVKNTIIESRHLKEEMAALKAANEKLQQELLLLKSGKNS